MDPRGRKYSFFHPANSLPVKLASASRAAAATHLFSQRNETSRAIEAALLALSSRLLRNSTTRIQGSHWAPMAKRLRLWFVPAGLRRIVNLFNLYSWQNR